MKEYAFGIDLGGTTAKIGLFTTAGALLEKWEVPTDTSNAGEHILENLAAAIMGKMQEKAIPAEQVEGRHDGHDLFGKGGDAPHAAEEHERGERGDDYADEQRRQGKGGLEGIGDGVGLDHAAHKAQRQDDRNGEKAS